MCGINFIGKFIHWESDVWGGMVRRKLEKQRNCFQESGEAQHVPGMLTAASLLQFRDITLHTSQGCWTNSPLPLKLEKKK